MSEQQTQAAPEEVSPEQALQFKRQQEALALLIGAVRLAQKRGAFTLEEAALVGPAVSVFAPPEKRPGSRPPEASGENSEAENTEAETEE